MKFKIITLIDVEETGERKGPNKTEIGQQANYDTIIQVLGLRSNPVPLEIQKCSGDIKDIGFGDSFRNKKYSYWTFSFEMPDGSTSIDAMQNDFNLVPIVTGLTETAKINISVFKTKDSTDRNIVFKCVDNN